MRTASSAQSLNCVRHRFGHAVRKRCAESGCELKLDGLGNHIVLKGELLFRDRKMPDCMVFKTNGRVIIGVVELKSGTVHASEIVRKLTNGTRAALRILKECFDSRTSYTFYHVVLSQRIQRSSEYVKITRGKVKIGKKHYDILPKRCGTQFATLLSL